MFQLPKSNGLLVASTIQLVVLQQKMCTCLHRGGKSQLSASYRTYFSYRVEIRVLL